MYCSNCGKEVDSDAKFCKYCGHSLVGDDTAKVDSAVSQVDTQKDADATPNIAADMDTSNLMEGTLNEKQKKRRKARRQREIEDAMALDNYTIKDDMVRDADTIARDRIKLNDKGTLGKLKTREILLIILCGVLMIASTAIVAVIHNTNKANESNMSALVIVGYFLFFVIFFALAFGIDRIYNLLTLNELAIRRITLKKFGFRLCPLALIGDKVYSVEIDGECDMCESEPKGTFHLEWQGDELIVVCNYDRKHIHKVNLADILGEDIVEDDIVDDNVDNVVDDNIDTEVDGSDTYNNVSDNTQNIEDNKVDDKEN